MAEKSEIRGAISGAIAAGLVTLAISAWDRRVETRTREHSDARALADSVWTHFETAARTTQLFHGLQISFAEGSNYSSDMRTVLISETERNMLTDWSRFFRDSGPLAVRVCETFGIPLGRDFLSLSNSADTLFFNLPRNLNSQNAQAIMDSMFNRHRIFESRLNIYYLQLFKQANEGRLNRGPDDGNCARQRSMSTRR